MKLTLDVESEQIIRRKIESGAYHSADEVVIAALRLHEAVSEKEFEEFRHDVAQGIDEADAGILLDGAEVFREARHRAQLYQDK